MTVTIFEAKTNLSELIKKVQNGEDVVITSGPERSPVATLRAVLPFEPKRLGVCYNPDFELPADFFDPPAEDELAAWGADIP